MEGWSSRAALDSEANDFRDSAKDQVLHLAKEEWRKKGAIGNANRRLLQVRLDRMSRSDLHSFFIIESVAINSFIPSLNRPSPPTQAKMGRMAALLQRPSRRP